MDKFIEWMKYKEYYITDCDLPWNADFLIADDSIKALIVDLYELPKQMLVGYMFEYLIERYKALEDTHGFKGVDISTGRTIEEMYDNLIEKIEELDK